MNGIWLLLGPEYGLKKKEVAHIKHTIESGISEDLEIQKFFAGDATAHVIASEIQSRSLFASYRLIQIFQADIWNASDMKIIAQALRSKDAETFIIMMSDATKIGATIEKIVLQNAKKIFWKLSDEDYTQYIVQKSQSMGLRIHDEAIDSIIFVSGESTLDIDMVLNQIAIFLDGERKKKQAGEENHNEYIMKEDIALWLSHFKSETVFKMFEDISQQQYEKAILTLEFLLQSGEHPSQIMAGLVYQIRNALRLSQAKERGEHIKTVLQRLNIRNFVTQKHYTDFIAYSTTDAIAKMLQICMDTEEALRSGGDMRLQTLIMSMMAYHICMLHHNPSHTIGAEKSHSYYNIHTAYLYDW